MKGNGIKCFYQRHSDVLPHRESNQDATFRILVRRFMVTFLSKNNVKLNMVRELGN